MSGPKTNERPGTRAQGRYLKGSASKARRVLNLIRNESVEDARTILQFSETGVSEVISKILESAVANAEPQRWHKRRRALRRCLLRR